MTQLTTSQEIDAIISAQGGWKSETLTWLRAVIKQADPLLTEEIKWKTPSRPAGLPVWSHGGILCIAEIWKDNIKLVFPKGALLDDPHRLFNSRLQSASDRAIELHDGDRVDETALRQLVAAAARLTAPKKS